MAISKKGTPKGHTEEKTRGKTISAIRKKTLTFRCTQSIMILWSTKSEVIHLSPRTGRPKAENPKAIGVKVRLDDNTTTKLDAYCTAHGITRAEAIRRGIHLLLTEKENRPTD
jgi:hypothetical protein